MSQYGEKEVAELPPTPVQPAQSVPKETYEAMFRHQYGASQPSQAPVDTNLVSAATIVLDARTDEANKSQANAMHASLQVDERHQLLAENDQLLPKQETNSPPSEENNTPDEPVDDLEF